MPINDINHHWKFDGDLTDSVGSAAFGGVTPSYEPGRVGQGMVFTNADGNLDAGDVADMNPGASDSFTLAMWCKYVATPTGTCQLLRKKPDVSSPASPGWNLYQTAADTLAFVVSDGTSRVFATHDVSALAGAYFHAAVVVDRAAGQVRLYVDNVEVSQNSIAAIGSLSNSEVVRSALDGSGFARSYDDLRFYTRALTPAEVSELFAFRGGLDDVDHLSGQLAYDQPVTTSMDVTALSPNPAVWAIYDWSGCSVLQGTGNPSNRLGVTMLTEHWGMTADHAPSNGATFLGTDGVGYTSDYSETHRIQNTDIRLVRLATPPPMEFVKRYSVIGDPLDAWVGARAITLRNDRSVQVSAVFKYNPPTLSTEGAFFVTASSLPGGTEPALDGQSGRGVFVANAGELLVAFEFHQSAFGFAPGARVADINLLMASDGESLATVIPTHPSLLRTSFGKAPTRARIRA